MSRSLPLDPSAPVASLLEASGLTAYALGKAASQHTSSVTGARDRGDHVALYVLAALVDAAGYRLTLGIEKK